MVLKRLRCSCFMSAAGKLTDPDSCTISNSSIQKHREHAFIWDGRDSCANIRIALQRQDAQGEGSKDISEVLFSFFATIINRVFTDEVVQGALMWLKQHQSQHAVSLDLLQESSLCPLSQVDFGLVSVHERQSAQKSFVPGHTCFCCYILLNA